MAQDTAQPQQNAPSEQTGEQEPSGPGHRIRNTTHRAGTPVNRSQVAQDTAHATEYAKRAHRRTGAKWPRTSHTRNATDRASTPVNSSQVAQDIAHTQNKALSEHTGEQEPSGPGHRTHATQRAERAHR